MRRPDGTICHKWHSKGCIASKKMRGMKFAGVSGDLGYTSTVEPGDGIFLTVWHEVLKDNPKAVLRQARWQLV